MRLLISIGCNAYDHAQPLTGAEADARRMFESLIRTDVGEYDPARSRLLLSPTVDEVRQALRDVLFPSDGDIDTFTFFFAGHGGVRAGSFYMWVCDSRPDAQSMSALSLSDLFRSINEAAPAQSNIIIDACESGGLIADLGVLLKSDVIGDAGTPGVTLVATSAQNQHSGETEAGGFGTNAILDCVEGRDFVQDSASTLDLVEIGRRISNRLRMTDQSPVVWGLNLYGPPRFCRNPCYGADPASPLRTVMQGWPSDSDTSVRQHYDQLWRAYASVSGNWNPRAFANVVNTVLSPLASTPEVLAGFAERLGAAVLERAELSDDVFRRAQVSSALAVCLLPHLEHEAVVRATRRFVDTTGTALIFAGSHLVADLTVDRYALLAKRGGGLSDLFFLPLRVAKTLGYMAAVPSLFQAGDTRRPEAEALFVTLLKLMLTHYSGSILTISDAQAPYWAVALSRAADLSLTAEADELTGLLFHSFVTCRGQLARWDIPPEKTLEYLLARRANDFTQTADLVERPNESLTVLMKAAALLGLGEVFDESLWKVDGVGFAAYLNADFSQYGEDMMTGGQNLVWTVGHNVFRVDDLVRTWPQPTPRPESDLKEAVAVLASLLYPNRVPWFCLDNIDTQT
ncbi:MAG: caspase family protein [Gallionellaceae bacterium]|nr:caspase family protein [Gallionellaceae bacterium]